MPNDRCSVTVTYRIDTHPFFKLFEPFFKKIFERWFWATWEEDAPMRLRRWKVHKLGLKNSAALNTSIRNCRTRSASKPGRTFSIRPCAPLRASKQLKAKDALSSRT